MTMTKRSVPPSRFLYNGSAFAFGGQIRRPYDEVVETQAATVLPAVGGYGRARVEDFQFRDLVSFRSAHSVVTGNESTVDGRRVFNTLVTVTLEDLNISDLITADRVVARLVSEKPEGEDELPINPVGSYISNLRIAGTRIQSPRLRRLFDKKTLHALSEGREGASPVDTSGHALKMPPLGRRKPAHKGAPGSFDEHEILTSIFDRPKSLPPGCQAEVDSHGEPVPPWGLHIPGFGTVYLGEFLITRYSRRLTMIRVKMGSPVEGDMEFGNTQGNGSTYP